MGNVIMKAQQITYGASNVEKALDDLKVPELIELNKRMDAIDAWKANVHEETYTGSELTIENALALPARSLITEINAIQDLHGLPFPYVGGAGKNKLPMTVDGIKALNTDGTWVGNDYTHNGVKFTILTDSANNVIGISANGTTSANHVIFKLGQLTLQGGINYTLTGCPSGGSLDGYRLSNWGSNTVDVNDLGSGATITVSNDELYTLMVYIKNSGTVLSNKIFYPMLRLSTESDPTFAPYSNICPISGRNSVVVDDVGRNIWDEVWEVGAINDTTGEIVGGNRILSSHYIKVSQGVEYYITFPDRLTNDIKLYYYDKDYNYIGTSTWLYRGIVTFEDNVAYFRFNMGATYGLTYNHDICINISDASFNGQYAPYQHSSATIQLGTTVYGADINWDTGVMTVKTAIVDLGTLAYTQNGTAQSGKYRYSATITGIKPNAQAGVTPNIISSQYKAETPNDSYSAVDGITVVNSDIYIYDSTKNTMSVADFKTAMNGVTAEYELATPTTIQLTPEQLEMLKGYNRVTIDNGSIELKALVLGGDN